MKRRTPQETSSAAESSARQAGAAGTGSADQWGRLSRLLARLRHLEDCRDPDHDCGAVTYREMKARVDVEP